MGLRWQQWLYNFAGNTVKQPAVCISKENIIMFKLYFKKNKMNHIWLIKMVICSYWWNKYLHSVSHSVKFQNQVRCIEEASHMREIIMFSYRCMIFPFLHCNLDSAQMGQGLRRPRNSSSNEAVRWRETSALSCSWDAKKRKQETIRNRDDTP